MPRLVALAWLVAAMAAGCNGDVVKPTAITYLSGTVAPGGTISGCGAQIAGCAGRLAITVRLTGTATGTALYVGGSLHATNKRGCLLARAPGFLLEAGVPRDVTLTFDQADACEVPLDIANLAVVVEGVVQVASRQEWAVSYAFRP
jgi:hypothetical protein